MAITWEDIKGKLDRPIGRKAGAPKVIVKRVVGPSSYATGGFDVTIEEFSEIIAGFVVAGSGYTADIDFANSDKNKLRVIAYSAAGTEVAAETDLSGVYFTVIAFGW